MLRERIVAPLRDLRRRWRGTDRVLIERYLRSTAPHKLHLGCGGHLLPGWLNSDLCTGSADILQLDATQRVNLLPDATFDYVFSEHMIEHVDHAGGLRMLRMCHRVLAPGGVVRISTPDLAFLLALHREPLEELQTRYLAWSAEQYPHVNAATATFVLNNFVRDWGHRFIYDEATLRASLERAGFERITRQPLGASDRPALRSLEHETRMPPGFLALETMTLEAAKPR